VDNAVQWLLHSEDPSVRHIAITEILDELDNLKEANAAWKLIPRGPRVRALLDGQKADGGFGVHPYQKWTGAHWRLVSLVELRIPQGYRKAVMATDLVLKWLLSESHLSNVPRIEGRYRRCASQEGNALAVSSLLGLSRDPRVVRLAESLITWQWPDGGWNCDRRAEAWHSSFNESLSTMWGLSEFHKATGDQGSKVAAERAAEFFLKHQLFRSCRTGEMRPPETFHSAIHRAIHPWTSLHYPLYWHYDILQALLIISRVVGLGDSRTKQALDLVEAKRGSDGLWRPEAYYWAMRRKQSKVNLSNVEVVDWGRRSPNEFITLNALRVLKAARRF
jgi:hypothetical protein